MERILIFTATYNEADNVEDLIDAVFENLPSSEILVVDDASPDGTGAILDRLAKADGRIRVVHRPRKLGLGTAHKLGMKYAVSEGYDILVTMDADFSHSPKYLPELLHHLSQKDFVIGSRYVKGGKSGYSIARTLISWTANRLARGLLRIPLHECTTSYRGFRRSLLDRLDTDRVRSEGYSFFVESLFYLCQTTDRVGEFPIEFKDRRAGTSKISKSEIAMGVLTLVRLSYKRLFRPRALKKGTEKRGRDTRGLCPQCRKPFLAEVYPAITEESAKDNVFRCTGDGHKSDGRIMHCLQCGLVYSDSQMTPESIEQM